MILLRYNKLNRMESRMRRLSVSGIVFSIAVGIGCGPGKELPDAPVRPREASGPWADPIGTPPTTSDPAARAILDRAIKAITGNDPGKLARAKVAKVTYQGGVMTAPQASEMTKAIRTIETVWPDFALVADDYKGNFPNTTFCLRGQQGWMKLGPQLNLATSPLELATVIRNDVGAWHWVMLGLHLADPKAVAFDLVKNPGSTTVKIALPERPIYQVTFDEATGLPVKTDYRPLESQLRVHKVFVLSEHKSFGGLLLPTKIELTQNDKVAERWGEPTWEFPESIDPSRFEQPKP